MKAILFALALSAAFPFPSAASEPYRVKRYREVQEERQARHARLAARYRRHVGPIKSYRPFSYYTPLQAHPPLGRSAVAPRSVFVRDIDTGRIHVIQDMIVD